MLFNRLTVEDINNNNLKEPDFMRSDDNSKNVEIKFNY